MNDHKEETMRRSGWMAMGLLAVGLSTTPARAESPNGPLRFGLNAAESKITASVAEPMAMIRGRATGTFRVKAGEVEGAPQAISDTGRVRLVLDAASYQTESDARDTDVKENALEVQKYPTITFESTGLSAVQQKSDYAADLQVLGTLTLHGVTKRIAVPVAVRLDSQNRLVADGTYTFKFEEYGVKRPSKMMGLMTTGDEVTIEFHVVADPV